MKIAIAGAGAMGCRFGYMLTKTGQEVTLIDEWPAHIEAIQKNGLKVVDGDNTDTIDIKIIRPEEATEEVDVTRLFKRGRASFIAIYEQKWRGCCGLCRRECLLPQHARPARPAVRRSPAPDPPGRPPRLRGRCP